MPDFSIAHLRLLPRRRPGSLLCVGTLGDNERALTVFVEAL